jgi:hypothetical protein
MGQNRKQLTREKLYEEIWTEPMTVVARRYNMSDVGLAKNCKKMNIPKPGLGYWAKIQAGQKIPRTPLPPLAPNGYDSIWVIELSDKEQAKKLAQTKESAIEKFPVDKIEPDSILTNPHRLINEANEALSKKSVKADERGILITSKKILDISVTQSSLERALLIMDALVKAMTKYGISIHVGENTNLTVDGETIDLSLSERIKRSDHKETPEEVAARERYTKAIGNGRYVPYPIIPRYDYHPTGVLTIKLGQQRTFNDTNSTRLEDRLAEIISCLFNLAADIKARRIERERKEEIARQKEERRQQLIKRVKQEKEDFENLEKNAKNWKRSQRIYEYINAVEQNALATGGMTDELRTWIKWARAKADWLNPMNSISDLLLDAPIPATQYWWQ